MFKKSLNHMLDLNFYGNLFTTRFESLLVVILVDKLDLVNAINLLLIKNNYKKKLIESFTRNVYETNYCNNSPISAR